MSRRHRFRRVMKWTGTIACIAILVSEMICARWIFISPCDGVAVAGGALVVGWGRPAQLLMDSGVRIGPIYSDSTQMLQNWRAWSAQPKFLAQHGGADVFIVIPLWIPFLMLAIPTAVLWRIDRRRPLPRHCGTCNYDPTGNVSDRCPECGTATGAS